MIALSTQLSLQAATLQDVAAVKDCIDRSYRHYIERIGTLPRPMTKDYAEVIRDKRVTVAVRDGAVVGVLVLHVTNDGFCLDTIGVDPENRGTGLGRRLLELAEAEARKAGFDSIYLYTHQRMTENQALYRKIGYVEFGRFVDEGLPRVFLRKTL
jgi:ribosomal protein S18 acetylase RimI-like enzyme